MLPRRVPLLPCALAVLLALPGALAAQEDFRLLVALRLQQENAETGDRFDTRITIYRGGVLRYEETAVAGQAGRCVGSGKFALGKGTPAQLQLLSRVLNVARVGQVTGDCYVRPGSFSAIATMHWEGPSGDRSNTLTFFLGPPQGPLPPACRPGVGLAEEAILNYTLAVFGQPDTRVIGGEECFPDR